VLVVREKNSLASISSGKTAVNPDEHMRSDPKLTNEARAGETEPVPLPGLIRDRRQHSLSTWRPIGMTVPVYRAGPASEPDPGGHDPREAVDDLFRRHADGLVRFALMLVGDQATAEDVVQEAFLGLYRAWDRAWDRVRDPDAVLGYLRTAVVNGARSVHRSHVRARLLRVPHDPPVWSAEAAAMDGEDRRGHSYRADRS
jgi:hypothetical protein